MESKFYFETLAYVIGVAIGDGNLSNPNGRAVRLRITCDARYPNLIKNISESIKIILPRNKISIINRAKTYIDISCYSNQWKQLLPWSNKNGPKSTQDIHIPLWIKRNQNFSLACIRGLIETDGCVYHDRGYMMVNFTTVIQTLANDILSLIKNFGFLPKIYRIQTTHKPKYIIRLAHDVQRFIELAKINKS